jgi:endonuclease YncB( thermonuclease family)
MSMRRFLAPALLQAFTSVILADELRGKVVSIADGDTITVLDANKKQHKVRLTGIDAPEKKQAFGAKSKDRLGELVADKDVVVEWKENDTYGRTLGKVRQGPLDVNLQMIKDGMAWHYRRYSKSAELSMAEAEAKAGKKGLWVDPSPVPPWEFRRLKKKKT